VGQGAGEFGLLNVPIASRPNCCLCCIPLLLLLLLAPRNRASCTATRTSLLSTMRVLITTHRVSTGL
jgi:hypothetical protein